MDVKMILKMIVLIASIVAILVIGFVALSAGLVQVFKPNQNHGGYYCRDNDVVTWGFGKDSVVNLIADPTLQNWNIDCIYNQVVFWQDQLNARYVVVDGQLSVGNVESPIENFVVPQMQFFFCSDWYLHAASPSAAGGWNSWPILDGQDNSRYAMEINVSHYGNNKVLMCVQDSLTMVDHEGNVRDLGTGIIPMPVILR